MHTILPMVWMTMLAASPSMAWMEDYGEALEATRQHKQPLLVVIENNEDKQQLTQLASFDATQASLLKSYTLCRVDASTEYGRRVAEAFKTEAFPTVAVIDNSGSTILYRKAGQLTTDEWVSTLIRHQSGQRPVVPTSFSTMIPYGSGGCPNCRR